MADIHHRMFRSGQCPPKDFLSKMKPSNYKLSDYARNQTEYDQNFPHAPHHRDIQEELHANGGPEALQYGESYAFRSCGQPTRSSDARRLVPTGLDYTFPKGTTFTRTGMPIFPNTNSSGKGSAQFGSITVPKDYVDPSAETAGSSSRDQTGSTGISSQPSFGSVTPDGDRPDTARRKGQRDGEVWIKVHPDFRGPPNTAIYNADMEKEDPFKKGKRYWAKKKLMELIEGKSKVVFPPPPPVNVEQHCCPPDESHCHVIEGSETYWTAKQQQQHEKKATRTQ
jgi:hypothetical protein